MIIRPSPSSRITPSTPLLTRQEGAFEADGSFAPGVSKETAINKIGHGLHELDDVYRRFTLENDKVKGVIRSLGVHRDPE